MLELLKTRKKQPSLRAAWFPQRLFFYAREKPGVFNGRMTKSVMKVSLWNCGKNEMRSRTDRGLPWWDPGAMHGTTFGELRFRMNKETQV